MQNSGYRVGLGFDLHRMQAGRKLILAQIEIPSEVGVIAHSDGDLVVHTIADALLGAAGKGDIGDYFPDSNPQFKGISSLKILESVLRMIRADYSIVNVDIVIILDYPRLVLHKTELIASLKRMLNTDQVNVKIKSCEGLYQKDIISCYGTVLLKRVN